MNKSNVVKESKNIKTETLQELEKQYGALTRPKLVRSVAQSFDTQCMCDNVDNSISKHSIDLLYNYGQYKTK